MTAVKKIAAAAVAVLFLVAGVSAQETRSVIFGRVTDPQDAAVAGATVVVTNEPVLEDYGVRFVYQVGRSLAHWADLSARNEWSCFIDGSRYRQALCCRLSTSLNSTISTSQP